MNSLKIKKNDKVVVLSGKDKGKTGKVLGTIPSERKVVVEGIMGSSLPWELIAVGAAIAVVLALCRVPVMPCAIGIYLPVGVNAAIFVGGAARYLADRRKASSAADSPGTLFAAGLVAGEGLCGILLALVALMCR